MLTMLLLMLVIVILVICVCIFLPILIVPALIGMDIAFAILVLRAIFKKKK